MPDVRRFPTVEQLIEGASRQIADVVRGIALERECMISLSGGETPRSLYEVLSGLDLPWDRMAFFFGDERHVPADDSHSNYRMAHESLFSRAPIPPRNIHRVPTEIGDAELVAKTYETTIATEFELRRRRWPRFDLVLLGLGADGHTASLFPGTRALEEREKIVTANYVETMKSTRITLPYPVFNAATFVMFLVAGAEKAEALKATLEGDPAEPTPARRIRPTTGRDVWKVDQAAASLLSG